MIKQINFRFDRLLKTKNNDLNDFLIYTFEPLLSKVWENSEKNWPSNNLEKELPKSMQIFSPSDFGFHNAILKESGDLAFFAAVLGKVNMSGKWCVWCQLGPNEWSVPNYVPGEGWTIKKMHELRENIITCQVITPAD